MADKDKEEPKKRSKDCSVEKRRNVKKKDDGKKTKTMQEPNDGEKSDRKLKIRSDVDEATAKKNRGIWAAKIMKEKCRNMSEEFNKNMKRFVAPGTTTTICMKNETKNRYADVMCIDKTRVVLKQRKESENYIHANWMDIGDGNRYICTQGPLSDTIEDFWHMCFTENVSIILMLCDFWEGAKEFEKCAQYFPKKPGDKMKHGYYSITNLDYESALSKHEGITISSLEIKNHNSTSKDDTKKIKHVLMTSWVDQLAPLDTASVLSLWKWVKKNFKERPVVVHCSAGVGRTATFVAFEMALYRISKNPDINLLDTVKDIRGMRYSALQSHIQFLYLHLLLLKYLKEEGAIEESVDECPFVVEYNKHAKKKYERHLKEVKEKLKNSTAGISKKQDTKQDQDSDVG